MKIGLTGGTGFIGQYLLKEYCHDHEFVVLSSRELFDDLYAHKNVIYIKCDYNYTAFLSAFKGCDAVVHLGAKRATPENEKFTSNYLENLEISEELFEACNELGITNLVNISTRSVYDNSCHYPFSEEYAVSPLNKYAIIKLAVENLGNLFNIKHGMFVKSLRLAQVIGYGEKQQFMVSVFLNRCLNGQKLSVYGKGESCREYIYVKDVAYGIMCAINHPKSKGVFNLGTGINTSNLELANIYCKVFDNSAGVELLLDKSEIKENNLMDIEKAKKHLGFTAKYSIEDSIKDIKLLLKNK